MNENTGVAAGGPDGGALYPRGHHPVFAKPAMRFACALGVALVALYWHTGWELYKAWTLIDSYYTHGFLIPAISLYFLWRKRDALAQLPPSSSLQGYVWIVFAAGLLLLSDFLGFRVFGQFSLIPMLTGVWLILQGRERTRAIWFPLVFLIFMIPIPASLTQSVALQIKLLATECAVLLARAMTLPLVREGSFIHFGQDRLLVGDVCGGLRSLIALLAFGALMAYVSKCKPWARILLLVLAGPVAIVSNILRIFSLCLVGYYWGSEVAAGRFHDISGVLIFVVAFALFFAIETQLRRFAPAEAAKQAAPLAAAGTGRLPGKDVSYWHCIFALVVLLATLGAHVAILGQQAAPSRGPATEFAIPDRIGGYVRVGQDLDVNDRTRRLLETSTILMRNYRSAEGWPVQLTIVYAGTTRRSLHFPEVCLVGEGWEIREQSTTQIGILFSAKRLVLVRGNESHAVLYWFKTGSHQTGNYFANAFYWAKNQITFGAPTSAMIKLTAPIGPGGEEQAFAVLDDFALKFSPILTEQVN